jgi:hypothetical protein
LAFAASAAAGKEDGSVVAILGWLSNYDSFRSCVSWFR